jgi:L-ascorbate metabolism protein UlaG (beta-lactamase superfamily)
MQITWYGHAAFLIETEGLRIILDPYRSPDSGGYQPIADPADLVVVSHENDRYHSHIGQIVPPLSGGSCLGVARSG